MGLRDRFGKRKYESDVTEEETFTAFVIRGNRQVVQREVQASKRFRLDDETYIIRPECIFLKNIDGYLRSVSFYREGNPNPYNFEKENTGLTADELDRLFAEDFFHIVTNLQGDTRLNYLLFAVLLNLVFALIMTVRILMGVF